MLTPPPANHEEHVPAGLRIAAAWSWRLIVIGVVLWVLLKAVALLSVIVIPVLIALLLTALIRPIVTLVSSRTRLGPAASSGFGLLTALAIIASLITLIAQQTASGFPELQRQSAAGLLQLQEYLASGPFAGTANQIGKIQDQVRDIANGRSSELFSGALAAATGVGHLVAGFFLMLFATFFFLSDGVGIWNWLVGLLPASARPSAHGCGERAWATLTSFVRATIVVAIVDGLGVGVSAALLGVPLAVPLGLLVFLGAFIPIVGALISGSVAVLVALVAQGPVIALVMLGAVIVVQQVESHLLQPFLLGRAVRVHPLAVILAIAGGVILAGIVGALFAVPAIATANVVMRYLLGQEEVDSSEGEDREPDFALEHAP